MASGKDSQFIRDLSEKRLLGSGSGADLLHRNSDLGTPSNRSWWKFGRQPSEIKPPAANIQTEQPQLPVETAAAASDSHLQQEIDRLKSENREAKVENGRLIAELAAIKRSTPELSGKKNEEWNALQTTNRRLQAECEAYRQELAFKADQMKLLQQKSELSEDFLTQCQPFIDSAIAEYRRQFIVVQEENEVLKDRLRELSRSLQSTEMKLTETKRAANDATIAYQNLLRDHEQFARKESEYLRILKQQEAEVEEFKSITAESTAQLDHYQEENKLMQDVVRQMDLRIGELESSEFDLQSQLRQLQTEMEEAKVEKERSDNATADLQRELSKQQERLQQASERYKDSLRSVRQELQDATLSEKNKMLLELQDMQTLKAETDLQVERAVRDKRMAEKELESVKRMHETDLEHFNNATEDLSERVRRLERERDVLQSRIEARQNKENSDENRHEVERRQLTAELETTHQRVRRLEKECEDAKEEKMIIFKRLLDTESRLKQLQEEHTEAQNAHSLAVSALSRRYEAEAKEQKIKILQAEESIKALTADLQNLLTEQKRTAVRWKEESKRAADSYEHLLEEARQKLAGAQVKIDVLNEKCIQLGTLKDELAEELNAERKNHSKLHSLIKTVEQRAQNSARQIQEMLGRERELLSERKDFQRKIDQLQLEKQRWERERLLNEKRHQLLNGDGSKKFSRSAFIIKDDSLMDDFDFTLPAGKRHLEEDSRPLDALDLEVVKENLPDITTVTH